jgi:hypothetical protein
MVREAFGGIADYLTAADNPVEVMTSGSQLMAIP